MAPNPYKPGSSSSSSQRPTPSRKPMEVINVDDSDDDDDMPNMDEVFAEALRSSQEASARAKTLSKSPVKRSSAAGSSSTPSRPSASKSKRPSSKQPVEVFDLTQDSDEDEPAPAPIRSRPSPIKRTDSTLAQAGPGPSTSANRNTVGSGSSKPSSSRSVNQAKTAEAARRSSLDGSRKEQHSGMGAGEIRASKRSSTQQAPAPSAAPIIPARKSPPLGAWDNPQPLLPKVRRVSTKSKPEGSGNLPDDGVQTSKATTPPPLSTQGPIGSSEKRQSIDTASKTAVQSPPAIGVDAQESDFDTPIDFDTPMVEPLFAQSPADAPVVRNRSPVKRHEPLFLPSDGEGESQSASQRSLDIDTSSPRKHSPPPIETSLPEAKPKSENAVPLGAWGNPVPLQAPKRQSPEVAQTTAGKPSAAPARPDPTLSAAMPPPALTAASSTQRSQAVDKPPTPLFLRSSETPSLAPSPPASPVKSLDPLAATATGSQPPKTEVAPGQDAREAMQAEETPVAGSWTHPARLELPKTATPIAKKTNPLPALGSWGNAVPLEIKSSSRPSSNPLKRPAETVLHAGHGDSHDITADRRPAKVSRVVSPSPENVHSAPFVSAAGVVAPQPSAPPTLADPVAPAAAAATPVIARLATPTPAAPAAEPPAAVPVAPSPSAAAISPFASSNTPKSRPPTKRPTWVFMPKSPDLPPDQSTAPIPAVTSLAPPKTSLVTRDAARSGANIGAIAEPVLAESSLVEQDTALDPGHAAFPHHATSALIEQPAPSATPPIGPVASAVAVAGGVPQGHASPYPSIQTATSNSQDPRPSNGAVSDNAPTAPTSIAAPLAREVSPDEAEEEGTIEQVDHAMDIDFGMTETETTPTETLGEGLSNDLPATGDQANPRTLDDAVETAQVPTLDDIPVEFEPAQLVENIRSREDTEPVEPVEDKEGTEPTNAGRDIDTGGLATMSDAIDQEIGRGDQHSPAQPQRDALHTRIGSTDPLAIGAENDSDDEIEALPEDRPKIEARSETPMVNSARVPSPAPSSSSSIQETTVAEFNKAVPAFKSAKPEGMSMLDVIRSKRAAQAARASGKSADRAATSSAGLTNVRPTTAAERLKAAARDDERTRAERAGWRRIVEEDGASDVDVMLDADGPSPPSSSSMTDVDRQLYHRRIYDSTQVPPEDRRGKARREFDSAVVDDWNARYEHLTKKPALHRIIVSSYFRSKELDSGEIRISNDVDAEGVPPDLEFEYSNEMLYGPDVPDPELGLGCECEGPCDENSTTCSCLKRQMLYFYGLENLRGFAYNPDGTVKNVTTPIWECGETCGCPPSCMNRVIQRGRAKTTQIELIKTRQKGWGIQASAKIPKGTFIGVYAGELISEECSEQRGQLYTEIGRTYIFDLDGWQISNPPAGLKDVDPRLAETAEAAAKRARRMVDPDGEAALYNAFSVDAFHYGNVTRFFNHSCDPNLETTQAYVKDFHPERPLMVIFARRDVEKGEELCISYKGIPDEEEPVLVEKTKGKQRQSKTSTAAHVTVRAKVDLAEQRRMKNRCYCGSANCDGKMFNID